MKFELSLKTYGFLQEENHAFTIFNFQNFM